MSLGDFFGCVGGVLVLVWGCFVDVFPDCVEPMPLILGDAFGVSGDGVVLA